MSNCFVVSDYTTMVQNKKESRAAATTLGPADSALKTRLRRRITSSVDVSGLQVKPVTRGPRPGSDPRPELLEVSNLLR